MYYAKCTNCHKRKADKELKIYDVGTDRYFCNQKCKDKFDNVKRDKNGSKEEENGANRRSYYKHRRTIKT